MKHAFHPTTPPTQAVLRIGVGALLLSLPALAQTVDLRPAPVRAAPAFAEQAIDRAPIRSDAAPLVGNRAVPARTEVALSTEFDGTTWVSGTSYKASFGADGATYIPRFGPDAPRNFPVSLTLARATAGGVPIDLRPVSKAVRDDHTVTIDRGPIDEVYVLALDHVEQRFVVKERPRAGALDLFVPLSSELELTSEEGHIELRSEHGTVKYGHAFVLLEDGSRVPLDSNVEDGAVRIHVNAEIMASARFPLVIDPIVSTFAITAFGFDSTVSYDATTDRYLIVWEDTFSSTDHDIFWHMRGANGTPFMNGTIDNSTEDCRNPQAANLYGQTQFLCVMERRAANSTFWKVWGRTIQASNGGQSSKFLISTEEMLGNKLQPDVGGDPYFGEAYYCVVWKRDLNGELDIHARLVRFDTTLVGSSTMMIDNTVGAFDSNPSISKSSGNIAAAAWTIAWQRANATADIYAARLSYSGAMLNAPTVIAASTSNDTAPAVSSPRADGRVCLVYGFDDYFNYKLLNGVTVEAQGNISDQWPGQDPFFIYEFDFSVDTDGTHFVASFTHQAASSPPQPHVLTLANVTPTTLVVSEGPLNLQPGESLSTDLTSKWSSGGPNHDFGIVWDGAGIDGATFYRRSGGPYSTACTGFGAGNNCPCANTGSSGHGCANSAQSSGALLAADGSAATGADDSLSFVLSNTPAGSPAILFQGTGVDLTPNAFGDGTLCAVGTVTRFALKFPNSFGWMVWPQVGAGESPLSTQGAVPLAGAQRWYQAYYRDSASFCTSSTFNISNGVVVQWLP